MATCRTEPIDAAGQHRPSGMCAAVARVLALTFLLALAAMPAWAQPDGRTQVIRVAAASDLRFALDEIAATFEQQYGHRLRISYGSTGNFAHQIRSGAPFHLFLAADERYIETLAGDKLTRDAGTLYATGRMALVAPRGTFAGTTPTMAAVASRLADHPGQRFAIANPDHAPYGERGRDVLQHLGLWASLQSRLVYGENVSQAAQFALSGNTVGGLVAWSLALAPEIAERADSALLPAAWHRPLKQRMVLLQDTPDGAVTLYNHLQSPQARAVLERYGFSLPPGDR
ncbi:MAG: molybdate ABC transporter substrate-binding protein [Chromatocurvus sp.]